MLYKPTNWANGDKITADKLNKIELGLEKVKNQKPLIVKFRQITEYRFLSEIKVSQVLEEYNKGRTVYFDYSIINGKLDLGIVNLCDFAILSLPPYHKNISPQLYADEDEYIVVSYPDVQ